MNIAILCHTSAGGSGVVATELGIALAEIGHTVHLLGNRKPFRITNDRLVKLLGNDSGYQSHGASPPAQSFWAQLALEAKNSVVNWLPNNLKQIEKKPTSGIYFHELLTFDYPLFSDSHYTLRAANSLAELIKKYEIEIVHAHYAIPHGTSAILARDAGNNIKVVTTVHGTDVTLVGMDPAYAHTTKHALLNSDAVTAVSNSLAQSVIDNLGIKRDITVIHNWVDSTRFRRISDANKRSKYAQPDEAIIVHASNFRPIKRSTDVINIFSKILEHKPARLLMIGDGPEREACIELAAELDVLGRTQFLDFTPNIERLLGVADLLLLPSDYESFGLIALEAMSAETIVIASSVGGLPEVIEDGQTGILLPSGDIEGMAAAAVEVLKNIRLNDKMRINAREIAISKFSPHLAFEKYLELYQSIRP